MSYSDNCRTLEFTDWPPFSTCHHLIANRPNKSRHSAFPLGLISGGARFAYGVEIFLASPEFAHCVYRDTGDEAVYWIPIQCYAINCPEVCWQVNVLSAYYYSIVNVCKTLFRPYTIYSTSLFYFKTNATLWCFISAELISKITIKQNIWYSLLYIESCKIYMLSKQNALVWKILRMFFLHI